MQRGRRRKCPVTTDEFSAVAGDGVLCPAQIKQRNAWPEILAPGIACQQRTAGVDLRHHIRGGVSTIRAQLPLHVGGNRQVSLISRMVSQAQARNLDRVVERYKLDQFGFDVIDMMLEAAESLAMMGDVITVVPDRQCGRCPQCAAVFIAHIEGLDGRIADRIVAPRRQCVFLAVTRPRIAAAGCRGDESELRIGDHVGPRHRRRHPIPQDGDETATVLAEASDAIVELQDGTLHGTSLAIDHLTGHCWGSSNLLACLCGQLSI